MELIDVIDLDNLHQYSNFDGSTIEFDIAEYVIWIPLLVISKCYF